MDDLPPIFTSPGLLPRLDDLDLTEFYAWLERHAPRQTVYVVSPPGAAERGEAGVGLSWALFGVLLLGATYALTRHP